MKAWLRLLAGALGAGAALGLTAAPAQAEGGSISLFAKDEPRRTVTFFFSATDPSLKIDDKTVRITADGKQLPKEAFDVLRHEKVTKPPKQVALLVIDTSGSMKGDRIEGAKDAAHAFLGTVPSEVEVGMMTFADDVKLNVPPTTSRAAVENAVDDLVAKGETALYDAVSEALQAVGQSGVRRIVVLSDGEHKGTPMTLRQATQEVARARDVRLDAVALQLDSPAGKAALRQLTAAGRGEVISANSANELADKFETVARSYRGQVAVTVRVPRELADGEVTIGAEATAGGEQISASQRFLLGQPAAAPTPTQQVNTAPRPVAIDPGLWSESVVPYVALALVFAGASVVLGFMFNAFQPIGQRGRISRRLAIYTLGGRPTPVAREATVFGQGAVIQGAVDLAGRFVAQRSLEVGLRRRLDAAGLPVKPAEWALIQVGSTVAVPVILGGLTGNLVLALLGLVIGAAGPVVFLMIAESRRRQRFLDLLPDTLQLIAGSLSTGYSLPQAIDSVVQEGTEPVAGEFNRALVDHRLGRPVDDSLLSIANRMRSEEWRWVVMAIRIQREVGGNLAELLTTVADTLRERARLHRQVKALSAEGRLSAYILTGLPIVFAIYLLIARPDYIRVLFTDPIGLLGLALSVGLLVIGTLWLRKTVKVEI